jgi:hypothetical protein
MGDSLQLVPLVFLFASTVMANEWCTFNIKLNDVCQIQYFHCDWTRANFRIVPTNLTIEHNSSSEEIYFDQTQIERNIKKKKKWKTSAMEKIERQVIK